MARGDCDLEHWLLEFARIRHRLQIGTCSTAFLQCLALQSTLGLSVFVVGDAKSVTFIAFAKF
jgi:hypothetical protein